MKATHLESDQKIVEKARNVRSILSIFKIPIQIEARPSQLVTKTFSYDKSASSISGSL
ncbi:hypothetical protein BDP81DRAFT_418792 [Colletotrichum phormii]|uniref:Uncharacterized protein n=1 Tax=Colletotrichum phormii TaxID=359342 RepID=A0AAJ0EJU8_9PEZI|nr:uncharacterized protein BDP81DRAFT_418792 [Colletotrichum phormii]KAK1641379.1 hypothetical protein BDP81DRAFT_418792 [Colletotrichum phormii]